MSDNYVSVGVWVSDDQTVEEVMVVGGQITDEEMEERMAKDRGTIIDVMLNTGTFFHFVREIIAP